MSPPFNPRGNLVTPVAYDENGDLRPLLVDSVTGYLQIKGTVLTVIAAQAVLQDQKANTTAGGTFTSGAWQIRTLNTEVFDPDAIVSLAVNVFTLIPGKYRIDWSCPAWRVDQNQSRLYNVTAAAVVAYGNNALTLSGGGNTSSLSMGSAYVDINVNTQYRIEHRCQTTQLTSGCGNACSFGNIEVYTTVTITKIG